MGEANEGGGERKALLDLRAQLLALNDTIEARLGLEPRTKDLRREMRDIRRCGGWYRNRPVEGEG